MPAGRVPTPRWPAAVRMPTTTARMTTALPSPSWLRPASCGRASCRSAARQQAAAASALPPWPRRLYSTADRATAADEKAASATASTPISSTPAAETATSVYERYRSRLEKQAQQEGVEDIDALKKAYAAQIEALRRRDAVVPEGPKKAAAEAAKQAGAVEAVEAAEKVEAVAAAEASAPTSPTSAEAPPKPAAASGVRPLTSFIDVDKARALPAEELTAVWRLRFAGDALSLCAVIPAQTYAAMEAAARARPQFVLPVPHPEQGAEVHFLQWTFGDGGGGSGPAPGTTTSTVLFTQLAEYKLRGEFAQPHTTVTHYTDLVPDCGVVLMQGQVDGARGVPAASAQWLVMCLQRFYGAWAIAGTTGGAAAAAGPDEGAHARRQLLQWFAAGDPQFTIERLMEEVEKLA